MLTSMSSVLHCDIENVTLNLLQSWQCRNIEPVLFKLEAMIQAVTLLALAVLTSAELCSNTLTFSNGAQFRACIEGQCVTGTVSYAGITPSPSITLCKQTNSDGTTCYTATSDNICNDVPMRFRLGTPAPDFSQILHILTGFGTNPTKVCFQPPAQACPNGGGGNSSPVVVEPTPDEDEDEDEEVPDDTSILSDEDRQTIVDQHNHHRRNTNPSAADMMKMKYSLSLGNFAQNYLDRVTGCPLRHNSQNDMYGENVYLRTAFRDDTVQYNQVVTAWYSEDQYYTYGTNRCNPPPNGSCGHYTQVVWDDTEEVGCGMKQCVSGPWIQTLVVCNYSPPGNVRSFGSSRPRRPYTSGAPCSRYPSTHSACQNGLCVEPGRLATNQWNVDMMKILRYGGMGMREWDMGAQESDDEDFTVEEKTADVFDEKVGDFVVQVESVEDGRGFRVEQNEVESEGFGGWIETI